ncbi:MAG: LiaF domain-containing protein [Bacteroidales bacterium]
MHIDNLSFWGIFLIIAGLALLIRVIFNFDFPVVKIMTGLFFILLGWKIIFGSFFTWPLHAGENEIFFRSLEVDSSIELHRDYQIVFSQATFDFSDMEPPEKITELVINNIFSGTTIYLPADMPVIIKVDAVFAGVKMPGRNSPIFGKGSYRSDNFQPGMPHLNIEADAVFGSITFMHRR